MKWLYGLDLGNGLGDIGSSSVYLRDTLTDKSSKLHTTNNRALNLNLSKFDKIGLLKL